MAKKNKIHSIDHYFSLHNRLREALGNDLVYHLTLDYDHDGKPLYVIAVSTHKSATQRFNHDKPVQSAILSGADLEDDANNVVDALIQMYKAILILKTDEDKAVDSLYNVDITLKNKDGNILQ